MARVKAISRDGPEEILDGVPLLRMIGEEGHMDSNQNKFFNPFYFFSVG